MYQQELHLSACALGFSGKASAIDVIAEGADEEGQVVGEPLERRPAQKVSTEKEQFVGEPLGLRRGCLIRSTGSAGFCPSSGRWILILLLFSGAGNYVQIHGPGP